MTLNRVTPIQMSSHGEGPPHPINSLNDKQGQGHLVPVEELVHVQFAVVVRFSSGHGSDSILMSFFVL